MILLLAALAVGAPPPAEEPLLRGPITEIEHPLYEDALGTPLTWPEVRALTRQTSTRRQVRRGRVGRTILTVVLAGATAVEAWGAARLAREGSLWGIPLGIQAAASGVGTVALLTEIPLRRRRARARLLRAASLQIPAR